jgi:hypothetical protein
MTFEEINADLRKQGWRIWHIGESTKNTWTCILFHLGRDIETSGRAGERASGRAGVTGYDRDCWRQATGPTLFAAMGSAGAGLLSQPMKKEENDDEHLLDLEAMLA